MTRRAFRKLYSHPAPPFLFCSFCTLITGGLSAKGRNQLEALEWDGFRPKISQKSVDRDAVLATIRARRVMKVEQYLALGLAAFLIAGPQQHYYRRPPPQHVHNESPAPERSFSNEVRAGNSTLDMRTIVPLLPKD
jgi:hypothetical protein